MQSLLTKLNSLGLRVDLATTAPSTLETDDFLVFTKIEGLITDAEGKLVPKLKIAVGGVSDDPEAATNLSVQNVEHVLDATVLQGILAKGFGYDVAVSNPFYQRNEKFLVVGKVETFDFDAAGKPRTLSKVAVNIFNNNPSEAQKEALKTVLDIIAKMQ